MEAQRKIVDIHGNERVVDCIGCAMQRGEISSEGGCIATTAHFDAHQDFEIPIPGFVIVASRRHVQGIDEFTEEERIDFIEFLSRIRRGMREALGIEVVYLIQEEDTADHFHVWLFPRWDWMEKLFGKKIPSVRPIMEYARTNLRGRPETLNDVRSATERLRTYLRERRMTSQKGDEMTIDQTTARARFIQDAEAHLENSDGMWAVPDLISVQEVRDHLEEVEAGTATVEGRFEDWLFDLMLDRGGGLMPGRRRCPFLLVRRGITPLFSCSEG